MASITTRELSGTGVTISPNPLSNSQLDQNFINLNDELAQKLPLSGGTLTGALTVGGNLTVNGTTFTINSTTVTVDDPIFTLGGDTVPTTDDNKDRGIEFRWHNGTTSKVGFFGFDDSTGKFTFVPDATNTSEVFSGTKGTIDANIEWTDVLSKPNYVASVATTAPLSGGAAGSVGGTLTLSLAAGYGDTQNPYGSKTTSTFLAAPSAGNGAPSFRAIVASDIPTLNQNTTGNAATATTLATARNINGVSFNGSADITIADSTKLPLSGGTLTGSITTVNGGVGIIVGDDSRLADRNVANTLFVEGNQNNDRGYINFSSTTGNVLGAIAGGALTWNGNTIYHSGNIPTWNQSTTGNAATASTWQTARTITIGNTGKSVDGSAAVSWTLAEIGAYAATNPSGYQTAANINAYFGAGSTSGTLDWNDVTNTKPGAYGTLLLGSATNGPGGSNYYHPFNLEYSSKDGTGNVTQMAVAYSSPGNELYMRGRYGGSWNGWTRFLNSSNYNSYSPTLTGTGASGTWGINITGNAATVTNGVYTTSNVMLLRSGITDSTYNSATTTGLYTVSYTGYSRSLMVWNTGGSTGIVQLDVNYGDTGEIRLRNATDSVTWSNWRTFLTSYNYNNYSPTLTGGGASGTWSINITGNAATATTADQIDSWVFRNTGSNSAVNADTLESNGITYYTSGVTNFSGNATDGALYSQFYSSSWQHQIAGDYRSGQIALRGKNNGTWQAWRTVLDSSNYNSYSPTLTGSGASGTWGINVTGYSTSVNLGNSASTQLLGSAWAGGSGYPGYQFSGGNSRFGFSSTSGVIDVYTDGNYYANEGSSLVLHAGNYSSTINYINGNLEVAATDNSSTSYSVAALEIRETNRGSTSGYLAPRLAFHWGGVVASQVSIESSGRISIRDNPGSSYENFIANISYASASSRAPIFYDADDTSYYLDPNATTSLKVAGNIEQGNNLGHPNIEWAVGGSSTGMVIFSLPGAASTNYGMVHMVFDYYEYVSGRTATIIIGGHNWSTSWYETGCTVIGNLPKEVRLGVRDGKYCVIFGVAGSTWNYATIRLRKIHNAGFYDNILDVGGSYSVVQTTIESFTNVTGDLRQFYTPKDSYAYAYRGHSNVAGTGQASFHPAGIYSTGTNWLYGSVITNNNTIDVGTSSISGSAFYSSSNSGYYLNPTSTSRLSTIYCGNVYNDLGGWFRSYGNTGLYSESYGNHFYATSDAYWNIGANNGSVSGLIFRTGGHQGTVRGYVYSDSSNNIGFLNSGGSWRARVVADDYWLAETSSRSPIFYDSNNSGYYWDGASTSKWNESNQDGWHTFNNYGLGVTGTYDSTRLQTVFAMGSSYRMAADGTATSNMYGIAWSHPNAGTLGGANNLNDHGILIINNGGFRAAISSRAVFSSDVRGTLFYDYNDTGYYCDPNSSSYLHTLLLSGASYFRPQNWIQLDSAYGLYWPNTNGAHVQGNDLSSYGSIAVRGSRSGWRGIHFYDGGNVPHLMFDGSANGGIYFETGGRWASYYSYSNNCWGFGTSGTSSAYNIYCPTGVYSGGRSDGTIFYDANDTGYYVDPNSASNLVSLTVANTISGSVSGSAGSVDWANVTNKPSSAAGTAFSAF